MIEEDNRASHDPKHIDCDIGVANHSSSMHIQASIRHHGQYFSEAISGDRDLLWGEDLREGLREELHHGGGVRKEQREAVSELVLDLERRVLLGHLHAGEIAPVEGEVVLDGRGRHLRLVELDGKVYEVAELLGRRLLLGNALLGRLGRVAEGHHQRREHALDLLRVLVVAGDLVDTGKNGLPGGVLGLGRGRGDGLADELVTALVHIERLQNVVGPAENGGDLVPDGTLFFGWLAIY